MVTLFILIACSIDKYVLVDCMGINNELDML